jgi:prevent-host-death family protein
MPKTVTASEAKNRLGSLIQWALTNKDEVVIKSRGEPKVVIMPYQEYQTVIEMREQARRRQALAQLEALRDQVQARKALTEKQATELADRFTREVVEELVEEGKVKYQGR